MKIEIDRLSVGVTVSEFVIRDMKDESYDGEGERPQIPHLQARIQHSGGKRPQFLLCDLAYCSVDGGFLGLDKYNSQDEGEDWRDGDFPLSMPLTVPDGAATAKLGVWAGDEHLGFWSWAGRIIALLFMVLLLVWIWRVVAG